MKKIADFIVNNRKWIMVIFAVLTIACAMLIPSVKVNYDQSIYLPTTSDTAKGMAVMKEEFGVPGSMTVMVKNISLIKASEMRSDIDEVSGVSASVWIDTLLLTSKTDDSISDGEYLDLMLDMLTIVYKVKNEMFPDRSLGYVYGLMLDATEGFGNIKIPELSVTIPIELFGDGGQSMANIDTSTIDMLENYYTDGSALITVTMKEDDYAASTTAAIESIFEIAPQYGEAYYSGQAISFYYSQADSSREIIVAAIIAVALILFILFISTSSYLEPVVYILVILSAILINMGTNFFLGAISTYSNMIGALLQLALSMDYSIFLLHSYAAEKKTAPDRVTAMKNALRKSLSPISASSLTTIAGFVALMFMRFSIGFDFGMVLAKGILLTLLCVFGLMPGIVLGMDKALEKTAHRSITQTLSAWWDKRRARRHPEEPSISGKPLIDRYASGILKMKRVVPALFAILMIPAFFFQSNNNFFFGEFQAKNLASSYTYNTVAIMDVFGYQNTAVVLISNDYADCEDEFAKLVSGYSFVKSVTTYSTMTAAMDEDNIPHEMSSQFIGNNYRRILISLDLPEEGDESFAAVNKMEQLLADTMDGNDWFLLGTSKSLYEISDYSLSDSTFISLLTLAFILLIIILTFRSAGIPVILGVIIQGATWINMAIPFLMGDALQFLGYIIVSGVQMGSTIDYGILLTNKYIEARKNQLPGGAARTALRQSLASILTAGSILVSAGFALALTSSSVSSQVMGMAIGRGTLISMASMLFILPQALALLDKFIKNTSIGGKSMLSPPRKGLSSSTTVLPRQTVASQVNNRTERIYHGGVDDEDD